MRILIIKTSALGDIVQAFSVLGFIKKNYPDAQVDWVVELPFLELVQSHPDIHRALSINSKKWRSRLFSKENRKEYRAFFQGLRTTVYDLILDLQGNIKSGLVMAFAKSSLKVGFGMSTVPEWPNVLASNRRYNPPLGFNIREDYLFLVRNALGNFSSFESGPVKLNLTEQESRRRTNLLELFSTINGLKVMVFPGSNWPNKQLSLTTLKNFLHLIESKLEVYYFFMWGTKEEEVLVKELALDFSLNSTVIDKLSLPLLQNMMNEVDLNFSMDSLPLHLAGTTTSPVYSVFGASSLQKYQPIGPLAGGLQGACPYGKSFEKRCPILRSCSTGACIKNLDAQQLFENFYLWWSQLNLRNGS